MKKTLLWIVLAATMLVFNANAQTTIFSEDFETGVLPAGWTVMDVDGDGQTWSPGTPGHGNDYNGYASISSGSQSDNWMITPAIQLGSSSTLTFYRSTGFFYQGHYGVYVSTTSPTDLSSFALLFEETPVSSSYAWTMHTVNLADYENSTVYIAFRHYNTTSTGPISIDDIEVTSTMSSPIIMATPASLQFLNVTANTYSAPQLVTVNTVNVTGGVTATVNAPFELSTDSVTYNYGVTLTDIDHNLYVRYSPTTVGEDSAVVSLTSGSAVAEVLLYGNAISCDVPIGLSVSSVTSTSAVLNWTGSANSYNIYYKVATATEWDSVENVPADPAGYLLGNLTPSTSYSWYVAAVCDDGTLISSASTGTFTTSCGAYTAPFTQGFDASSLPQCWGQYTGLASNVFAGGVLTSTTSGWNFYNTQVFGAHHARLNIYGTSVNRWLVTPAIDLSTLTTPMLTFDLALTAWNSAAAISNPNGQPDDKFMVIVSTDDGATWSAADATVWSNDSTGDFVYNQIPAAGQEISISLADYANQTVRIAFYGESTVENGDNDLHIDNVTVSNANFCAKPTNLAVTAVTGNSVTLDWVENGTATSWNIEYGPAGYQQGSSAATVVTASTVPFTISNMPVAAYDFYVQADCGDEQSLWVGPVTASPGSFNMGLQGTDTMTTCSMIVYDNGGASANYAASCDYTLVLMPANAGSVITVSGSYHTESCCDSLRIFDGVGTTGAMLGLYKGTGTIPTLASSTGPLTLHFKSDYGLQYEGFALTVSCADCAAPGNLTVSNIGSDSATLAWAGISGLYTVEYKADQDTAWTSQTTSDTFLILTGLAASTPYTVRVYSDCGSSYSPYITATFATTMVTTGIPYSTDFSNTAGWVLNNGGCGNYWTIASVSDTANALFVTNNGTTPGYATNGAFSAVSAEKLFTIGTAAEFAISFDVQIGGESLFDYMKVFFAPADAQYPAATTNTTYSNESYSTYAVNFSDYLQYSTYLSLPYKFNLTNGNTVHVSVVMPNPNTNVNANSTAKLVFLWKNDTSDGTPPGAIVRHVSVEAVSCAAPTMLTVSNITTTSADLTWSPEGSENDWMVEYKEENASTWTSLPVSGTPACSLTGLIQGSIYQVRVQALCSATEQSLWVSTELYTLCDAITTFPFTEDFEHGGHMPDCWSQEYVSGNLSWHFKAGAESLGAIHDAHSGDYNAYLFEESSEGRTTRLVTPILNLTGVADPYLTYWHAQQAWGSDQDVLSVHYRISPNDPWLPLTQHNSSISSWAKDSLALPNPSATYQIAFTGLISYGHGIVLDDITVNGSGSVPVITDPTVTTLAATNIAQTAATLNGAITNPDNVTITARGFELTEVSSGDQSTITVAGSGNSFSTELTNLTAETAYSFRAFITYNGNTVFGSAMTFTTEAEPGDSTGVANRLAASVTLYPNPANEVVNVECTMNDGQWDDATVEVYDVYGKLVNTVVVIENPTRINVGGLSNGVYFVRVTTDRGVVTKPFVKR